jgi:hypothetical protein
MVFLLCIDVGICDWNYGEIYGREGGISLLLERCNETCGVSL